MKRRTQYVVVDRGEVMIRSSSIDTAFGFLQGLASPTATLLPLRWTPKGIRVGNAMDRTGQRKAARA